ncbi:MAG: NUDIX hydrolase [Elusimicrobia bacterium]|nr:NUDIX hydrolase [Elusimicrobiota bacterium]
MKKSRTLSKKWKILKNRDILNIKSRLKVSVQRIKLPNGKIINDYYRLHLPESVIIVARTPDKKIVMSRQYLHGLKGVSIILPAGMKEKGEDPLKAAKRELVEETGYTSDKWYVLNSLLPHNNYGAGKVHFFFADNARRTAKPKSGDLEKMEIILLDEPSIIDAINKGKIVSAGSIASLALTKAFLYKKGDC